MKIRPALKILILLSFVWSFASCEGNNETNSNLIKKIKLNISEPSGITEDLLHTSYWIVSGGDQKIYKTDLNGKILQELLYQGDDIEGICFDKRDSSLWITEEKLRNVVHLNLYGKEIGRIQVNISGNDNKGIEGVTLDKNGSLWVVNEKYPGALYKIDASGNPVESFELNYTSDISDVAYDFISENFYILSDESSCFFSWNPLKGLLKNFSLPRDKYEGISINEQNKTITVVNDDDKTLLVYTY